MLIRIWAGLAMLLAAPLAAAPIDLSYGPAARQKLTYSPAAAKGVPLVVFVHGGGWMVGDKDTGTAGKPAFFTAHGYAFATLNYRMVPEVTVEGEAQDVAAAIGALVKRAGELGFDATQIALVGHSAGAHLVALIGTDPRYLEKAGVPLSSIRTVSLLDGAGYDVPRQMREAGPFLRRIYVQAFGTDEAAQKAVSPTLHAAAPNAGAFQIFHLVSRPDSTSQAEELAGALKAAGTPVALEAVSGKTHASLNRMIGSPGDKESAELLAFLDAHLMGR